MENIAFVLGNGKSRLELDLPQLKETGIVYGCNALHRNFVPDVLVSTDPEISEEIQNSGYPLFNTHYTRKPIPGSGSMKIEHNFGYSSGPIALTYAALSSAETIYFAGFDLEGIDGKFNNVFEGTTNYKESGSKETHYGNWVTQIAAIMKTYNSKKFVRIVPIKHMTPDSWLLPNYSQTAIGDFVAMINNINPK